MNVTKFKTWRVALLLIALSVAITALVNQDQIDVTIWLYIATIVLFVIGFPMALNLSFRYLFGLKPRPNYVFEPWYRQLFILSGSGAFKIERDGVTVEFVLMRGNPRQMDMWVYEPEKGIGHAHTTTDKKMGEFVLSNGAKLYFVKQPGQIKVWWSEVNKPWKIVEEK